MSTKLQLSSSAMGWKTWVCLRINHLHNQEEIFSIETGFCQFSQCNMVRHKRIVRSLITTIYLPAKLFLLRPSGNIQDFLRYLSDCPQIFFYQVYNSLQWRTSPIRTKCQGRKWGGGRLKIIKLCRYGSKMKAYLTFRTGIAFQGWFTESWAWAERVSCLCIQQVYLTEHGGRQAGCDFPLQFYF